MARLKNLEDGRIYAIQAQCTLGRSPSSTLPIGKPLVSELHAKLSWNGDGWEIRDLGSRNGTYVDGRPLRPGVSEPLEAGARIGLGGDHPILELVDGSPPALFAVDVESHQVRSSSDQLLVLPDEAHPEVSIYAEDAVHWVVEDAEGEVRPLRDGDVLSIGGRKWRIELPLLPHATPLAEVPLRFESVFFRFLVSSDEERVDITLVLPGREIRLEPREHSYVLVTLARARLEDAAADPSDRGWRGRDVLLKQLKIESNAFNVAIHRARQQLAELDLEGAAKIVEVRRGERRLGTDRFEVLRGD